MYHDPSYYGMWAVRYVHDKSLNIPIIFHFNTKEEATSFMELLVGANYSQIIKEKTK